METAGQNHGAREPLLAVNGEEVGPLMSGYSEKNGLEGFVYHYRVAGDGPGTYSCVPRLSFGGREFAAEPYVVTVKPASAAVSFGRGWLYVPVGALLYVGGAARKILAQFGVKTIGELAACKRDALETLMGKMGVQLHDYANGLDTDPVRSRYEPEMVKSVGNGTTFPKNLTTAEQVRGGVAVLADSVATRLRHSGLYAGGVQVTVRDPQFHDRSRQMQLSAPTHLIRELTAAAMDLTGQLWKPPAPVRALTVTAIHLVRSEDAYEQVDLFTAGAAPKKEKQEKLEAAMDRLRGKFGTDVISYGAARPEKEEDPLP